MGFTVFVVFVITIIEICVFVGIFADAKNLKEELHIRYIIESSRYCNLQNKIKKMQKELEEMKGEENEKD